MNYKTTLVVAAIAAAIAALGSAFPLVGTASASIFDINEGDTNTGANTCTGELGNNADCRAQGFQVGRENEQTNNFD